MRRAESTAAACGPACALASACTAAVAFAAQSPSPERLRLSSLTLPPGFSISVYADNVPNARSLALGPGGTVFVGTRTAGNVYALVDANRDQKADEVLTLATRTEHAQRRRRPRRVALRGRELPHPPVRQYRGVPPQAAGASRGQRVLPRRHASRLEVHRVRARRPALRPGGRALQRVRARRPALCLDHAHEAGRHGRRGVRQRRAQHGRFRLAPGLEGTVVHRQRARPARRRCAARRAEPCDGEGPALRVPVLPGGHGQRPDVRREAAVLGVRRRPRARSARTSPRSACGSTRARCSRPRTDADLHRRARVVESQHADRLPRDDGHA